MFLDRYTGILCKCIYLVYMTKESCLICKLFECLFSVCSASSSLQAQSLEWQLPILCLYKTCLFSNQLSAGAIFGAAIALACIKLVLFYRQLSAGAIFGAAILGFSLSVLFFMDQNIRYLAVSMIILMSIPVCKCQTQSTLHIMGFYHFECLYYFHINAYMNTVIYSRYKT